MRQSFKKIFMSMRHSLRFFIINFLFFYLAGCAPTEKIDLNTVTVWHWMSDRQSTFEKLAKKYQDETGTKVKFELYAPSEAYSQTVKASAQSNTLPDIYGILGEKRDFGSFIKSGFVMDLTEALNQSDGATSWKDRFFSKALAVNEFLPGNDQKVKPGLYGIPVDAAIIEMVYNKKLYKEAGLDPNTPPTTWEEFIGHCSILKEKGIPRLVSGFGEIWMIDALASNLAMNLMGDEKVFDTYRGKVPYTDPDWIRVLSAFKQMAQDEIIVPGAVTMVNKTAEQTFANERAAYAFNGSWCINVYAGMNPNLEYGAMPPPKLKSANPARVWGGAGSSFVVNQKSPRNEQAVKFLKWLTEPPQQEILSAETKNFPAVKMELKKLPPLLAEFADDMDLVTHPNIFPVREDPAVTEAFDKGIQSILIGEKKPEEVAKDVQRTKEKQMAKKAA
jgi:ABC-type glycerol-3-phosphate transport system substrate-binding protein